MASDLVHLLPRELARALWDSLPVEACVLCARVSCEWLAALVAAGAPTAGYLRVAYFVESPALLSWARAQARPCPWNESVCAAAARGGHLATLQWARSCAPPCPWDGRTCTAAAQGGRLPLLQWARAQEPPCPWGLPNVCAAAARGGHLALLQWAGAQAAPREWDAQVCASAAGGGHLEVLRWALGEGCPRDERTCAEAAESGHLGVLRWARAQGCPWDDRTCLGAAYGGRLGVLQWARAQDPPAPWDEDACAVAAGSGHLGFLQWARAQDPPCPWDEEACEDAARAQQFEVLCWLRAQRPPCPWWDDTRALVERCYPSFVDGAAGGAEATADRALVRVGRAAPGRGPPSVQLGCSRREGAGYWLAFFGDAERARDHVREYVLGHLYEVFTGQRAVVTWVTGSEEVDMLKGVELVGDRFVRFGTETSACDYIKILDLERAAENGGYPAYDNWAGGREGLAEAAASDALENLEFLVGFARTWLRAELPGRSACRLSELKYAGRPAPPVFSSLVVFFAFPELPEPTGRLPLPPSEDWR
jgi:hypothetical protein